MPVAEKIVWSRPFCNLINFEPGRSGAAAARSEAADRRADVRPLRDAAARHGRGDAAACRCLHHRLGRCPHGAGCGRQLRSRRLHRLCHRHAARTRAGHSCHGGVPALRSGAGGGCADGGERRPIRAGHHDADGRPDRYPQKSDGGQSSRRGEGHRLVPRKCHHAGAVAGAGLHAQRLSGLPAAFRLHEHESRPSHHRAQGLLHAPREGRRRRRGEAPRASTTSISR